MKWNRSFYIGIKISSGVSIDDSSNADLDTGFFVDKSKERRFVFQKSETRVNKRKFI